MRFMGNALSKQRVKSVWIAIEDTPGEAANMKRVAELMRGDCEYVRSAMTQDGSRTENSVRYPASHLRLDARQVDMFSIDTLVQHAAAAEIRLELRLRRRRKYQKDG